MMETAVLVVWWIGLLGALIPTAIVLKEVVLILRALREITQLADRTAVAARGIAAHTARIPALPTALDGGDRLVAASGRLKHACEALAGSVQAELGGTRVERFVGWIVRRLAGARRPS